MFWLWLSILVITNLAEGQISWNFPKDSDDIFHVYLDEKTQNVHIYPPLTVKLEHGSKLCRLELLASSSSSAPDFLQARVADPVKGTGVLMVNQTLLYQARLRGTRESRVGVYQLKIQAEDCSLPPQTTVPWAVNVEHIPSDFPVWSERKYEFHIEASHSPGHIVGKVTAYANVDPNQAGDSQMGDDTGMCGYTIQDPSASFSIDGHGVIRSVRRFSITTNMVFQFNVTGIDCHLPDSRSSTSPVTITVQSECSSGWKNVPNNLPYPALSEPHKLAPGARLELCPTQTINSWSSSMDQAEDKCKLEKATIRMKILWNKEDQIVNQDQQIPHCDLDLLSLRANRKMCDDLFDPTTTELLPATRPDAQRESTEPWPIPIRGLDKLPKFDNRDYPTGIYYFNGSVQWNLNKHALFGSYERLDNQLFTLSFWMNHAPNAGFDSDAEDATTSKEHIICSSDGAEKNRHHFAVFLRNCKLVILIRREALQPGDSSDTDQLRPAQWRFNVEETCDTQWHHYAIVYRPQPKDTSSRRNTESKDWTNQAEIQLFIDGQRVPNDPELVTIADDYPLAHLSNQTDEFMRTSIGACWHARLSKHVQHFTGYLAGLTLTKGLAQTEQHLRCLTNCEPRLYVADPTFHTTSSQNDPSSLRNSHLTSVIIQTTDLTELEDILHKVTFFNPRLQYKASHRPEPVAIQLNTIINYPDGCPTVTLPDEAIVINPLPPTQKTLKSLYDLPRESPRSSIPTARPRIKLNYRPVIPRLTILNPFEDPKSKAVNITSNLLSLGIYVFPVIDLTWSDVNQQNTLYKRTITSCQVQLCPSQLQPQLDQLIAGETLTIQLDYLTQGLQSNQLETGLRLVGPSNMMNYANALRHIKWTLSEMQSLPKRCFQVWCHASLENLEPDTTQTEILTVKSNVLKGEFNIQSAEFAHHRVGSMEVIRHDFSDSGVGALVVAAAHQDQLTMKEPQFELRKLRQRHVPVPETTDGFDNVRSTQNTNKTIYACTTLAVIALAALILFATIRLRQNNCNVKTLFQPVDEHLEVVDCDTLGRHVNPNDTNHKFIANDSAGTVDEHSPLNRNSALSFEVMANPVHNQDELKHIESRLCLYNPEQYEDALRMGGPYVPEYNYLDPEQIRFCENPLGLDEDDQVLAVAHNSTHTVDWKSQTEGEEQAENRQEHTDNHNKAQNPSGESNQSCIA